MAGRYRPRKEYKFWLSHDVPEHSRLMEFIQYCKSTRQFAKVVRDGIRLIWSLREGNTSILFELFPHLERQFNPDAEDLIAQFREMLLAQRQIQPVLTTVSEPAGQGEKRKLSSVQLALPSLGDDDDIGDTMVATKVIGGKMNGNNFLDGVMGLGG